MSKKKQIPEVIEDADLDDATGGIALLLPAVQKVYEATITDGTSRPTDIVVTKVVDKSSPKLQ